MNIYPQEIEVLLKADKACTGGAGHMDIQLPPGTQIGLKIAGDFTTVSEIKRLCAELLPSYQIPMKIELLQELEKSGSGKIKRGGNHA